MKDYYKILGLGETATNEQIKKAFKEIAKKEHPDRGGDKNTMTHNESMVALDKIILFSTKIYLGISSQVLVGVVTWILLGVSILPQVAEAGHLDQVQEPIGTCK